MQPGRCRSGKAERKQRLFDRLVAKRHGQHSTQMTPLAEFWRQREAFQKIGRLDLAVDRYTHRNAFEPADGPASVEGDDRHRVPRGVTKIQPRPEFGGDAVPVPPSPDHIDRHRTPCCSPCRSARSAVQKWSPNCLLSVSVFPGNLRSEPNHHYLHSQVVRQHRRRSRRYRAEPGT